MTYPVRWSRLALSLSCACALIAPHAVAQVYVAAPANVPSGAPHNLSPSEEVDFADVDLDGDWDAGFADGGDAGNDQNRLWINQGFMQAGTLGAFVDETAARLPAFADQSRDLEFVDFDCDGDADIHVVNTASITNQGARWWTNQGGLQGGSAGFYVDETAARWVGLGGAGSSIPPSMVLGSGGYIHLAQEHVFADLDGDGDLDLIAAAVGPAFGGQEPTRVFLNDGAGLFSEFNPSGFQLTGAGFPDGSPGLWCQGVQQSGTTNTTGAFCDIAPIGLAVDAADKDADLDLDFLILDRSASPRMFRNLSENGPLALRDVTGLTFPDGWGNGSGKYEQDFGDLDGDGDLDLYGLNWAAGGIPFGDVSLRNDGAGIFTQLSVLPNTGADDDDGDLVDFDADGDLDLYVAGFSGGDTLLRNDFAGGALAFSVVPGAVSGSVGIARDIDVADVDGDGDYDVMLAKDQANQLLLNVTNLADTSAAHIPLVEQPADHAGGQATRIRAHVYDNAPDYLTAANTTTLEYSLTGGPFLPVPMHWVGAQVFRGELPSAAVGNVRYRVRSIDEHGNAGLSKLYSIHTGGGCSGSVSTYCTGKLNSQGCVPTTLFHGAPSATAGSGFTLEVVELVPNNNGLVFYSKSGAAELPFLGGLLCVAPPVLRSALVQSGAGGVCGGTISFDFNAYIAAGIDPGLVAGARVWAQAWARDPASASGVSTSDALTFEICP